MNNREVFKKEIKKDWYVQGFSAYPVYLNSAARSGIIMKKELGFGYAEFMFNYKNGYGEMWYLESDFSRIWKTVRDKMKKNSKYLSQTKKRYDTIFKKNEKLFSQIDNSQLARATDQELLKIMKACSRAATDGVGIAHLLDPIGMEAEKEFKAELIKYISDPKEFNRVSVVLTTPEESSFIAQEEEELRKIGQKYNIKVKDKLRKHAQKYFWIQSSFAGGQEMKLAVFEKRMKALVRSKAGKKNDLKQMRTIIAKYKFNNRLKELIHLINYATIWQDQRKANALKSVGYFAKVMDEINHRTKVELDLLHYLGYSDIIKIKNLSEIKQMAELLKIRKNGVLVLMKGHKEITAISKEYKELIKFKEKLSHQDQGMLTDLHGSVASQGTVTGRVAVCLGTASINKVKKGDILVASMTRPEFMPALKRAAAIVTDEGGVTCHAAIIARELGIPAVIGTKLATKILKDGDLVEVRANHGLVRVLKRNKDK